MKKKTALLALGLFVGSAGLAAAQPFVVADVKVAPGFHVAFGNAPRVAPLVRRVPAKVVVHRPVVKRWVVAKALDRRYHRGYDRHYQDGDRYRPSYDNHRNCF